MLTGLIAGMSIQNSFACDKLDLLVFRMAKTPWSFGNSECNKVMSESVQQVLFLYLFIHLTQLLMVIIFSFKY